MLACFGGAGGQHACAISRSLGIKKIVISKYSGILSAYGLSLADVVHEEQEPCNLDLNESNMDSYISKRIQALKLKATRHLIVKENFGEQNIKTIIFLNLRYHGTDCGIMCLAKESLGFQLTAADFEKSFIEKLK